MLPAKFQDHQPFGSEEDFLDVFAINRHGRHLGHVTWNIYIIFVPPIPKEALNKIWQSGLREDV